MKLKKYCLPIAVFGAGLLLSVYSCQHEPFVMEDDTMNPIDTTGNNNPGDTTGNNGPIDTMGAPCDPDVVYFELQVLPILRSNCAKSGCHDANSAQKGVVLTSYASVMATADVEPFNLNGSKLYRVITDDEPDDRMPQAPNPPLNSSQIGLISRWILQGAKDETCDPEAGGCNTDNVSYSSDIRPIIENKCLGCHRNPNPVGGFSLETHADVAAKASSGRLYGAVSWQQGFVPMPFGASAPLPDCDLAKIKAWVDAGAPNN